MLVSTKDAIRMLMCKERTWSRYRQLGYIQPKETKGRRQYFDIADIGRLIKARSRMHPKMEDVLRAIDNES